jgi:DNA-binding NarL/FixJ family response regulator
LIAEDHALLREAIKMMLASEADVEVVGEAQDGQEALTLCSELHPDLVLMDLSMPKMDGIEATRRIKEYCSETLVLVLTAHANEELLLEAVKAGAVGYILKGVPPARLISAVRETLEGEFPMDEKVAGRLLRRLAAEGTALGEDRPLSQVAIEEERAKGPRPPSLSSQELEVLRHVVAGEANRRIAQELHISLSTVKRYLERINSKLGVSDRTQAAVKAIELGLLPEREEE